MSRRKRTILLIDDSEVHRSCLAFVLTTAGYRVVTACGSEGLEKFLNTDVVIIKAEPEFPGVPDGYQLTEGIKRLAPETPVILYSRTIAYSDGIQHHADRFLTKRWSNHDLLEAIRLMMIRKRGVKPKPVKSAVELRDKRERLRA